MNFELHLSNLKLSSQFGVYVPLSRFWITRIRKKIPIELEYTL